MEFVSVAKVGDIPKKGMRGFVIRGKKILIAEVEGKFYAINSVCTHMHDPLEKGTFNGSIVTCPLHGSKFDVISGKVVNGPAKSDEKKFEIKVENGEIFVGI